MKATLLFISNGYAEEIKEDIKNTLIRWPAWVMINNQNKGPVFSREAVDLLLDNLNLKDRHSVWIACDNTSFF